MSEFKTTNIFRMPNVTHGFLLFPGALVAGVGVLDASLQRVVAQLQPSLDAATSPGQAGLDPLTVRLQTAEVGSGTCCALSYYL